MSFWIRQLDHVVLRVTDMDRAIAFYCQVLGCNVERTVESIGLVQLRAGQSLIDLVPRKGDGSGDLDHFALTIAPFEVEALKAHFSQHGITIGDVARRYGAEGYGPSIYLYDPDGNQVELKGPAEA
jgi:glyoxylase I family protein